MLRNNIHCWFPSIALLFVGLNFSVAQSTQAESSENIISKYLSEDQDIPGLYETTSLFPFLVVRSSILTLDREGDFAMDLVEDDFIETEFGMSPTVDVIEVAGHWDIKGGALILNISSPKGKESTIRLLCFNVRGHDLFVPEDRLIDFFNGLHSNWPTVGTLEEKQSKRTDHILGLGYRKTHINKGRIEAQHSNAPMVEQAAGE